MTNIDQDLIDDAELDAIEQVLDLTSEDDWPLLHNTVRKYVAEGRLSIRAEAIYKNMVDKKLQERALIQT